MATREQIEQALVNADKAGDTEAARALAQALRMMGQSSPKAPGFGEAFKQGQEDMAVGAQDFLRRGLLAAHPAASRLVNQFAFGNPEGRQPDLEAAYAQGRAEYEQRRQAAGADGIDWGRVVGSATSPVNVLPAVAGVPARAGAAAAAQSGAIGGALSGAMQPAGSNAETAINAGIGGAAGAVSAPAFNFLGKVLVSAYRKLTGAGAASADDIRRAVSAALSEQGIDPETVSRTALLRMQGEIEFALKQGRQLDPASLVRKADFEAMGVQPTLGQVTRDPMQWARERDMRGIWPVGSKLTQRLQEQRQAISQALSPDEVLDDAAAGDRLIGSLSGVAKRARGEFSAMYEQARQQTGAEAAVDITGLADDFGKILRDYGEDKIPSAIRNRLASYGVMDGKQTKLFTLVDAEQTIQQINKLYDPGNRAEASALNEIRNAIKKAVAESDVGDLFKPARDAAASWYRRVDQTPALKAVIEDKIAPDDFVRRFVINGKRDDLTALAGALEGDQEAIGAVRAKIIEHLQKAAFGADPAGDAAFSPARFKTAVDKLAPKIGAFFDPEEIAQLHTVSRVGAYINSVPNAAAPNMSNTAAAATNRIFDVLQSMSRIPGARILAGTAASRSTLNAPIPSAPMLTPAMQRIAGSAGAVAAPMAVGGVDPSSPQSDPGIFAAPQTLADLLRQR